MTTDDDAAPTLTSDDFGYMLSFVYVNILRSCLTFRFSLRQLAIVASASGRLSGVLTAPRASPSTSTTLSATLPSAGADCVAWSTTLYAADDTRCKLVPTMLFESQAVRFFSFVIYVQLFVLFKNN